MVVWQEPHSEVVGMCVLALPLALVPLWQLEQVPTTSAWLTALAGDQAAVAWQSSHLLLVVMWLDDLPVALVPLWQVEHCPVMPLCVKFAGDQAAVE